MPENIIVVQGSAERLTLEILGREQPDSVAYWGGNWLAARFRASSPGFQADFIDSLHLYELVDLRESLTRLYANSERRIVWKATEGILDLTAERDKRGRIAWTVEITYPVGADAILSLNIQNDQTYLPAMLNQLDALLAAFPMVGSAAR